MRYIAKTLTDRTLHLSDAPFTRSYCPRLRRARVVVVIDADYASERISDRTVAVCAACQTALNDRRAAERAMESNFMITDTEDRPRARPVVEPSLFDIEVPPVADAVEAVDADDAPAVDLGTPVCPQGLHIVSLPSTRYLDWWGVECSRCVPGARVGLPGEYGDKGSAYVAALGHYEEKHRLADDALTTEEVAEVAGMSFSHAQAQALGWARDGKLCEFKDGFWALDVVPDRWDVNKRVAVSRVTGLVAAGLLTVHPDVPGRRVIELSVEGRRVLRLWTRARRYGVVIEAPRDVRLPALPARSGRYPLLSEGRYIEGEVPPVVATATTAADPAPDPSGTTEGDIARLLVEVATDVARAETAYAALVSVKIELPQATWTVVRDVIEDARLKAQECERHGRASSQWETIERPATHVGSAADWLTNTAVKLGLRVADVVSTRPDTAPVDPGTEDAWENEGGLCPGVDTPQGPEDNAHEHAAHWIEMRADLGCGGTTYHAVCACGHEVGEWTARQPSISAGTLRRPLTITDAPTCTGDGFADRSGYDRTGVWEVVSESVKRAPIRLRPEVERPDFTPMCGDLCGHSVICRPAAPAVPAAVDVEADTPDAEALPVVDMEAVIAVGVPVVDVETPAPLELGLEAAPSRVEADL